MAKAKKRVFSMLLAVLMIASLIPSAAVADNQSTTTTESIPGGTNTITVTVNTSGNVETTTTTENWESSIDSTVTVGSSTTSQTVTDGNGATLVEIENTGKETSTTTTELSDTKTEENVVVEETPETTTDPEFVKDEGATATDTNNNNGTWIEGKTEEGSFAPTSTPLPEPVESGVVAGELEGNFLEGDKNNVNLWMDDENDKAEKKYELSFEYYSVDILPEELSSQIKDVELEMDKAHSLGNGKEITKTMVDGKVTYIVKTTGETTKESITEDQKQAALDKNKGEGNTSTVGSIYYEYSDTSVDETYKTVPTPDGAEVSTKSSGIEGKDIIIEIVKDADGNVIKEIERKPIYVEVTGRDGNKQTKIAYDVTETTYTAYSPENGVVAEKDFPVADYTELPKELPSPDAVEKNGETTAVSFESVLDESGKHVGYKAITTVTDKDGNVVSTSDNIITGDSWSYEADKAGNLTTTVTVSKLEDELGNHIGYTTTTTVTDKEGNVVSSISESVEQAVFSDGTATETKYGQTTVSTTKTQILSAQEKQDLKIENSSYLEQSYYQDISQEIYQIVETEDGLFLLYKGELLKVEVEVDYTEREESFVSTPDTVVSDKDASDHIDKSQTGHTFGYDKDTYAKKDWELDGYGLYSNLFAYEKNSAGKLNEHKPRLYRLEDKNGNEIYAYCIELGAEIYGGLDYGQKVFEKGAENNSDKDFEGDNGTMYNLRSIATNGYWGTESGIGSLQAVKDLMIRNGLQEHADILTDGMALVATQVAFWEYGKNTSRDSQGSLTGNSTFSYEYDGESGIFKITGRDGASITDQEKEAIYALRDLLVSLSKNPEEGQAEIISEDNLTGAGVVLKDYVRQTESGDHVYNTDVQFGLDISTSSLNGDLVVKVIVNGEVVGKARLAGDDNHSVFDGVWNTIYPDSQGIYTIEGVELTEGVPFTINLDGVQHLDDGIYMLHSSLGKGADYDGQDFISLTKQNVDIDITMDLKFTVEDDPNFVKSTQNWTEEKVDKVNYSREDSGFRSLKGTEESSASSAKVLGYTTTITTHTKTEKESSEWFSSSSQVYIDPPLMTLGIEGEIIEEEPVPLAKAPGTGNNSWIFLVVFLFSGCGIVALNVKTRKEN